MSADLKPPLSIELTQGKVALVSEEDFARFSVHKWHAAKCRNRWYARRSVARAHSSPLVVSMHREVPTVRGAAIVDHINGDSLDNRRANLRGVTRSENALNLQSTQFQDGLRCVFLQKGRFIVRVGKVYGGAFDNAPEAAFHANALLDQLSPGAGHRNAVDHAALIATLEARRAAIDALLANVLEAADDGA